MAEDKDQRTEAPSGRRLEKARQEEGQVPQSRELATFALLIASGAGLWAMGSHLMGYLSNMMTQGLVFERALAFDDPFLVIRRFYVLSSNTLLEFLPFMLLLVIVILWSPSLVGGWVFSLKRLTLNFGALNPLAGLARMFSLKGFVELGKATLKAILVGTMATFVIWHNRGVFFDLAKEPLRMGLAHLGHTMAVSFLEIVGSMLLIVAVDIPYQKWDYKDKLKMTKDEVKQENKEENGSPEVKGKIRQMQREMARRRMMAEIPKADVVVTNPTHYAVALRYQENMGAPKIVASGAHLLAGRIREIAEENSIPILEAPPLARALYFNAEVGDEIPEALYAAVAEVLAYVYQLKRGMNAQLPVNLPVPRELDPGESE